MRARPLIAVLLLALTASAPLAAGTLVLRDGGEVATRGGWRVEDRRVVFSLPQGALASLPAGEVDFARSRETDGEVALPPPPAERGRQRPILKITDADVGHVDLRGRRRPGHGLALGGGGRRTVPTAVQVVVGGQAAAGGATTITGIIVNHGRATWRDVVLEVTCERGGTTVAEVSALAVTELGVLARARFAVTLPVVAFDRYHMVVYGVGPG